MTAPHTPTTTDHKPKILLALDYGVKKMGMALGNSLTEDARPFDILAMNNGQPDWDNLLGIIDTWQIDSIVIGLPRHLDGRDSMLTKRAAKFARRLAHRLAERRLTKPIFFVDEDLSSQEARQIAWERQLISSPTAPIDDIAACLLLASYFFAPDTAVCITDQIASNR